jgi:integral membrane protein
MDSSPARAKNPIPLLRWVAIAEAISFLVLLGIAMPLKYVWGKPEAVLLAGSVHGALFLLFCWSLWRVVQDTDWPRARVVTVFVSSLLPFGPFVIDRRVLQWATEWRPASRAN